MNNKRVMVLFLIFFLLFSSAAPFAKAEKQERTWQDELIYSIMIDRFYNGDTTNDEDIDSSNPAGYHGGDIKGIIEKLEYIQNMGFTAIILSPLVKSDSYDGSVVENYYEVDEHYGTMEQVKQLVKEAHSRDMKVILSFTPGDNEQEMQKAALWWMDETDVDGYKINDLEKMPVSFWETFVQQVKAKEPAFYLISSASSGETGALYEKAGFDTIIDLSLYEALSEGFSTLHFADKHLYEQWKETISHYENPFAVGTMIDGENEVRFTRKALENRHHPGTRTKLALTYLLSAQGTPIVYYGTEIALDGGAKPDNDRFMNFRVDQELIDYITKVSSIRAKLPSLRKGTFELLYEKGGMMIYKREYKGETAVIALNNTGETQIVDIPAAQLEDEKELRGLLEEDHIRSTEAGYRIALDREKANIYIMGDETGVNMKFIGAMIIVYSSFLVFMYIVWKRSRKKRT